MIERLNEEFRRRVKTQTVLPCAETVPMLLWALMASGQIIMRKVDGWETLAQPVADATLDQAAWPAQNQPARRRVISISTTFETPPAIWSHFNLRLTDFSDNLVDIYSHA